MASLEEQPSKGLTRGVLTMIVVALSPRRFADICRALDYHNFVFSMKASNPVVMIQVTSATPERQPSV